jgi:hypothetical protein
MTTGRMSMVFFVAAVLAAAPACSKRQGGDGSTQAIAGLSAIPADAEIVFSFDVTRLLDSPLVERSVELVLARGDKLRDQWSALAAACQIDVRKQIRRVLIALGPLTKTGQPALMVVSGEVPEAKLATCVKTAFGKGTGEVSARTSGGRTIYTVKEADRQIWFAYGQADTIILGPNEAWVEQALAKGPKVSDGGSLKTLIARADQAAPIWAAGRPMPTVMDGLLGATGGTVKKPPQAVFASIDPSTGLRVEIGADMASEDDAKALEEFATTQLRILSLAAQWASLGPLVAKVHPVRDGAKVTFGLSLSMDEVNQLLRVIDSAPEDPQPSAPTVDGAPAVDAAPPK